MKMHESIHERENMVSKASLVLKTIVKSKKSMKSALACEKHQQKQIITFYWQKTLKLADKESKVNYKFDLPPTQQQSQMIV